MRRIVAAIKPRMILPMPRDGRCGGDRLVLSGISRSMMISSSVVANPPVRSASPCQEYFSLQLWLKERDQQAAVAPDAALLALLRRRDENSITIDMAPCGIRTRIPFTDDPGAGGRRGL